MWRLRGQGRQRGTPIRDRGCYQGDLGVKVKAGDNRSISRIAMKFAKSRSETLALGCAILALLPLSFAQTATFAQPARLSVRPSMEARSAFASRLENQLRQRGFDAKVQLDGDERDRLNIEWPGVSRSALYEFVNSPAVHRTMQPIGFRTIQITSGRQQWDYDVLRESMVWNPSRF